MSVLDIRIAIPDLPIVAPDPLTVSLGGSETAGLQPAAEVVRHGHRLTVACNAPEPFTWLRVSTRGAERRLGSEPDQTSSLCAGVHSARSLIVEIHTALSNNRITLDPLARATNRWTQPSVVRARKLGVSERHGCWSDRETSAIRRPGAERQTGLARLSRGWLPRSHQRHLGSRRVKAP